MKIKNFQESKCGVNSGPTTKRPSPPEGIGQKKKPILLELKIDGRTECLTNNAGIEHLVQLHNKSLKTLKQIAEAFGVPEEYLKKGITKND